MQDWLFVGGQPDSDTAMAYAVESVKRWWKRVGVKNVSVRPIKAEQRKSGRLAGTWSVQYEYNFHR